MIFVWQILLKDWTEWIQETAGGRKKKKCGVAVLPVTDIVHQSVVMLRKICSPDAASHTSHTHAYRENGLLLEELQQEKWLKVNKPNGLMENEEKWDMILCMLSMFAFYCKEPAHWARGYIMMFWSLIWRGAGWRPLSHCMSLLLSPL